MGALAGCNDQPAPAPESSSEVDPEASWPVHEWSAEEKAAINSKFETTHDIASLLPFYYVEGLEYKGSYTYVGSFESTGGSLEDVKAYALKLAARGFAECDDSLPSHAHFRYILSSKYDKVSVLNVECYLYKGGFTIDFKVGDLIVDHSFAGREVDLDEDTLFEGVSHAVEEHFEHFGFTEEAALVLPTELNEPNNIIQIDFIDYNAYMTKYFASYYENPYYEYTDVLEKLGVDFSLPRAQMRFTSDAKKDAAKLSADLEEVISAFEGAGFNEIKYYEDSVEKSVWRNSKGFEASFSTVKYDDGTGQYSGHPAYVDAYVSYVAVHDFSSSFKGVKTTAAPAAAIDAADAAFKYAEAYFENIYEAGNISLALGSDSEKIADTFTCEISDAAPYWYDEAGFAWPFLEMELTGWYDNAADIEAWFTTFLGWRFVAADPADEDTYDHYVYDAFGVYYEATYELEAATASAPATVTLDIYVGL